MGLLINSSNIRGEVNGTLTSAKYKLMSASTYLQGAPIPSDFADAGRIRNMLNDLSSAASQISGLCSSLESKVTELENIETANMRISIVTWKY